MTLDDFITRVFCLTDDFLADYLEKTGPLRQRGPEPTVPDSVVLTCELVGEFLSKDTDSGIFTYFRRHHSGLFPELLEVHRTTFGRQASNLWKMKERLQARLHRQIDKDPFVSIVSGSFPVPVCRFARAYRCLGRLAPEAAYGHDAMQKQTFYGLRGHVAVTWPGVIRTAELAPANTHDTEMAPHVLYGAKGWTLADSNYWSPDLFERLEKGSLSLLAPSKSKKEGTKEHKGRWSGLLTRMRRRVETVIGQLTGRSRRQESVGDGPVARLEPVDQKSDQSYDGRFALPT
jgi:hypothetical protein